MANGRYMRRMYISPDTILKLLHPPEGMSARYVAWQDDRGAFMVVLDMPAEDDYFVGADDIIPVFPMVTTVVQDEAGGEHLKLSLPGAMTGEAVATNHRDRAPKRKASKALLAAEKR